MNNEQKSVKDCNDQELLVALANNEIMNLQIQTNIASITQELIFRTQEREKLKKMADEVPFKLPNLNELKIPKVSKPIDSTTTVFPGN